MKAACHKTFLKLLLPVFDEPMRNVVCPVRDNCHAIKALVDMLEKPRLVCLRHRFNLAVQKVLNECEIIVYTMYRIVVNMWNLILFTIMGTHHGLRPILMNKTRRSSAFQMQK